MKKLLWISSIIIVSFTGCGGGGTSTSDSGENNTTNTEIALGGIDIPSNVTVAEILNAQSKGTILSDTRFQIDKPSHGSILTLALTEEGEPVLAGWIGEDSTDLTPRSTAEVIIFFAAGGYLAPPPVQSYLQTLLKSAPEIEALAELIEIELGKDEHLFASDNLSTKALLQNAINTAIQSLFNDDLYTAGKSGTAAKLLINPTGERSGLRLDTLSGLNDIRITNSFRRSAYAFVDRVSVFNDTGEVASPKVIKRVAVESVKGLEGGVGTIAQILAGTQEAEGFFKSQNIAYVPKTGEPINLPNEDGAKKTRYRIAIVGGGYNPGDYYNLTVEETDKQREVLQEMVVKEIIIPLIAQIIVPRSDLEDKLNSDLGGDLVQDLIGIITKEAPSIWDKSANGDLRGAIEDAKKLVIGLGTVRDIILLKMIDFFFDGSTDSAHAAAMRATQTANSFIAVSGGVDFASAAVDLFFLARAYDNSNEADIWTVDASDAKITITPENSKIKVDEFVSLEARVVDAGEDTNFEYRFSIEGNAGKLQGQYQSGNEVTGSIPFVTYDAQKAGTDYVRVEILEIVEGLHERQPVGETTAIVKVVDAEMTIEPGISHIETSESVELSANVSGEAFKLPLDYIWSTAADFGNFTEGGNEVVPVIVTHESNQSQDNITYEANQDTPGKELVNVKVVDSNGRLIGEDDAFIKVGCDTTPQLTKMIVEERTTEITYDANDNPRRGRGIAFFFMFDEVPGASRYIMDITGTKTEDGRLPGTVRYTGDELALFQPIGAYTRFYFDHNTASSFFDGNAETRAFIDKHFVDGKLGYYLAGVSTGEYLNDPESVANATYNITWKLDQLFGVKLILKPICD